MIRTILSGAAAPAASLLVSFATFVARFVTAELGATYSFAVLTSGPGAAPPAS